MSLVLQKMNSVYASSVSMFWICGIPAHTFIRLYMPAIKLFSIQGIQFLIFPHHALREAHVPTNQVHSFMRFRTSSTSETNYISLHNTNVPLKSLVVNMKNCTNVLVFYYN